MKIGDCVRFLNTTGGGMITGFQSKEIALVEDEDGFEIPILTKECVVIEQSNSNTKNSSKEIIQNTGEKSNHRSRVGVTPSIEVEETTDGDEITIAIGLLSSSLKHLSESNIELYLINDSNYFLHYNLMTCNTDNATLISRANGIIEPNTKLLLNEIDRTNLSDYEKLALQCIAFKEGKPFELKEPCSVEISIDTTKLYKLHCFKENDYFEDNAIIYYALKNDNPTNNNPIITRELAESFFQKRAVDTSIRKTAKHETIKKNSGLLEIDLHIATLLDSTKGLSAKDILDYQLTTFTNIVEEHKREKGKKIVFIHGKGDGILKNAMIKKLTKNYPSITFQDASFSEYGFGATMITIK